jgi:predicted Rossmann fold nucleotide-binding protein DprA/Smf involved in DNA uptake
MTDVAFSDAAAAAAPTGVGDAAAPAKRGRPRPDDVIARDEQVLAAIPAEGLTRDKLAEVTGLPENRVYQSLWRLRRDGRVRRGNDRGARVWVRAA